MPESDISLLETITGRIGRFRPYLDKQIAEDKTK